MTLTRTLPRDTPFLNVSEVIAISTTAAAAH